MEEILRTEVVVVGSGMSGLVAAVKALENDAHVTVVEKGPRPGGTTIVTGGYLRVNEDNEPKIAPFEPLDMGVDWLESLGISVRDPPESWVQNMRDEPGQRAKCIDPPDFVDKMVALIDELGGEFRFNTPMKSLRTGLNDDVTGIIGTNLDGERVEIEAGAVILASGDYSGNIELFERFTGYPGAHVWLRRDPRSTGDGFLAAIDIGAKTTGNLSKVEGHCMVAPPAEFTMAEFRDATQYYAPRSIAIDSAGRRFVDESVDIRENNLVEAILENRITNVYYISDDDIYNELWPHEHAGTRIDNAKRFGGTVIEAESLIEFERKLDENGVDGGQTVNTIEAFNEAVRQNAGGQLSPARRRLQHPIDSPPFYAVKVQPGISFFFGGLDVNHNGQVIDRAGSVSSMPHLVSRVDEMFERPIKGLYAAGVEVGRPETDWYYEAGLSLGLATGRIAGKHAAEYARIELEGKP